jgi:hypothetical protein
LEIESDNIACFEVFGTPDSKRLSEYNNFAGTGIYHYVISQYKSSFPSELEYKNGQVLTHGGLILLKIIPRKPQNFFKANIKLSYKTYRNEPMLQSYPVSYELPNQ